MKVCHWTQFNQSGMNNVARSLAQAERDLGSYSIVVNSFDDQDWTDALDADVHVAHTWFPELYQGKSFRRQLTKPFKVVFVGHGTPEHVFNETVESARHGIKGDGWMLYNYWLRKAHAHVTFWDRHATLLRTMVDTATRIDCLPLGIDLEWWAGGKWTSEWPGNPSLWSGENPHNIKSPLDLILAWPLVYPELDGACLYLDYLVSDRHRQYAPLINGNTAGYGMHWSAGKWPHAILRDLFKSIGFFVGLVKYGDHNMVSQQANAAGAKTISYPGNPHSDFWVHEGDHRWLARDLIAILKGEVAPRQKTPVSHIKETAAGMMEIYKRIAVTGAVSVPVQVETSRVGAVVASDSGYSGATE